MNLSDLKKTVIAKLPGNAHLFAQVSEAKKQRKVRKDCKGVVFIRYQLMKWAEMNGQKLEEEYKFHPLRKYRFDFAFPELKISVEYEGGLFMKRGGHNSPAGIQRDVDKYMLAQSEGWKVLRFHVKNYKDVIMELEKIIK